MSTVCHLLPSQHHGALLQILLQDSWPEAYHKCPRVMTDQGLCSPLLHAIGQVHSHAYCPLVRAVAQRS